MDVNHFSSSCDLAIKNPKENSSWLKKLKLLLNFIEILYRDPAKYLTHYQPKLKQLPDAAKTLVQQNNPVLSSICSHTQRFHIMFVCMFVLTVKREGRLEQPVCVLNLFFSRV